MFKHFWRRFHLTLACIAAIFLLITSLSGALLIYAQDIQRLIWPEHWLLESSQGTVDMNRLVSHVEHTTQDKLAFITVEKTPDHAWAARLTSGRYVNVNPYTGEVLYEYDYYQTLYGFSMALHRWLWWMDEEGNTPLRNWVSVISLFLIIEVLLGFYLWVKPKNRLKRLKIKPSAQRRMFYYQLHQTFGVFLALPLVLIAFSGIAFNWSTPTSWLVNVLSPGQIESRLTTPKLEPQSLPIDQQKVYKKALAALPEAELRRIYFSTDDNAVVRYRIRMPGETYAYSYVWLNPYSAEVLQLQDMSQASFATQVWNFRYKFHIGGFAGPLLEVVWLMIALSPILFIYTGCYFWLKRHKLCK
ncbi:PepSY-associated TM helix domain-containing protein [Gayadomonas joobiniege]|uniref:PepSY-associated TM helix domain-containing protein n=1 Tax=Gayadomonas joobiniege TaxID=1234606 RepID=UPI00037A8FF2|nr:PepSY-associated TM helix domain-containing protein [Gayadomonas joobiniege]